MNRCDISIVMPVFHEEEVVNEAVDALYRVPYDGCLQIIVVDGDPEGRTTKAVRDARVEKVHSEKGRGRQMNAGAAVATGEILLFLHADTELPPEGLTKIRSVMRDGHFAGGSFDLRIGSGKLRYRLIERMASLRSRLTRMPYGDQAIFLRKECFTRLGGFRERGIMEDVDLVRRIRRSGGRLHIMRDKVTTSARRWEQEGALYCTLRNWMLLLLYLLGLSPERLARFYPDRRAQVKNRLRLRKGSHK
jgi:rSAM/selenodomain-associated transferase 2